MYSDTVGCGNEVDISNSTGQKKLCCFIEREVY